MMMSDTTLKLPELTNEDKWNIPSVEQLNPPPPKRQKKAVQTIRIPMHSLTDVLAVAPGLSNTLIPNAVTIGKTPQPVEYAMKSKKIPQPILDMMEGGSAQHVKVARQAVCHVYGKSDVTQMINSMLVHPDSEYDVPADYLKLVSVKGMRQIQHNGMLGPPRSDVGCKGDAFPVCIITEWQYRDADRYGMPFPVKMRLHPFYLAAQDGTLSAMVDAVSAAFGSDQNTCWAMRLFTNK